VESKAENLGCSHSTARVSNAAIRKKARVMNTIFSCAESIGSSGMEMSGFQLMLICIQQDQKFLPKPVLLEIFQHSYLRKVTIVVQHNISH
jgi:hypothetical protein